MTLPIEALVAAGCGTVANVAEHWPRLVRALERKGIAQTLVQVGLAATVAVETDFRPRSEDGGGHQYDGRDDLGNGMGDGDRYKGRGFIQLTGRRNYAFYGKVLGLDLLGDPELANEPDHAARIAVEFFARSGAAGSCLLRDWRGVRRRVNGGFTGWDRFARIVKALEPAPAPEDVAA